MRKGIAFKKTIVMQLLLLTCFFNLGVSGAVKLDSIKITSVQQNNLMILSRLYGYARYFYPNPNLKDFNWLRFLMYAVPETMEAKDNAELRKTFQELFTPLVPEMTFSKTAQEKKGTNAFSEEGKTMYVREICIPSGYFYDSTIGQIKHMPYSEGLPYPDKIYSFKLTEGLYINYPIALAKLSETKKKYLKELIKKTKKIEWNNKNYFSSPTYRLANALISFNYVTHFYPYFEEDSLSTYWDTACAEHLKKIAACTHYPEYLLCAYELMSQLHDSHVSVMNRVKYIKLASHYQPYYLPWNFTTSFIENRMIVTWSGIDSLKRGDEIIGVNNTPIDQFIAKKLKYISASTPASALLKFKNEEAFKTFSKDSVITLSTRSLEGAFKKVNIIPDSQNGAAADQSAKFITNLGEGIYKINPCIDAANYKEFSDQFTEFKEAKGIVIDMRGYPRDCIYSILSNLIDTTLHVGRIETPIYYFPNQQNRKLVINHGASDWAIYPATQEQKGRWESAFTEEEVQKLVKAQLNVPIVFITNAECMSKGETVMEMVKRQKVGKIVGEPTCGTNGNAISFFLNTVGYVMTSQHFVNGDGTQHHGIGVLPDVPCSQTLADFKDHKDTMIEKAKSILKGNTKELYAKSNREDKQVITQ